jgi:hypothetical protein
MSKITGRVEILISGKLLLNKPGATASGLGLSGSQSFELSEVLGDTGLHGFVEKPVVAKLEVTITDRDDVKLADLAKINGDGTVIFRNANGGKSYTMGNATCTRNFTLTGGEGETPIVFIGAFWTENVQ